MKPGVLSAHGFTQCGETCDEAAEEFAAMELRRGCHALANDIEFSGERKRVRCNEGLAGARRCRCACDGAQELHFET